MALAQKQTRGSMEQDRESRNKSMHVQSINIRQWGQEYSTGKNSLFNKWCWENQVFTCKQIKSDPCLIPLTKFNFK